MRFPEQLPTLKGPVYAAYRVAGALLILVSLLSSTVGMYFGESRSGQMARIYYGAALRSANAELGEIRVAPFGPEAARAGVQPGQLVAIDGIDVRGQPPRSDKVARLLRGREGSAVTVTIAGRDGATRSHTLKRSSRYLADAYAGTGITFGLRKAITMVLNALTSLIVMLVCLLLYLRRPRDPVAALLVIGLAGLGFNYLESLVPIVPVAAIPKISAVAGIIFFAGMLVFPAGKLRPRWPIAAFGVITALSLLTQVISSRTSPVLAASLVPAMLLITAVVLYRRFVALPPGVDRQQLKWAALGVAGLTLCLILQAGVDLYRDGALNEGVRAWLILMSVAINCLGTALFNGGLLVALLRYRLYDAEAAISRSAAYAALTVTLVAIFAGTEKFLEVLGEQYFGGSLGAMAGGIAAALAAVTIAPLHHRITQWAEKRFQKGLIQLRRDLPMRVADLRETADVTDLAERTLRRVATTLRAHRGVMTFGTEPVALRGIEPDAFTDWRRSWIEPDDDTLSSERDDPLLPVRVPLVADGCGRVGWLLLGPRPDGSLYGKDEREALSEIADPVARALAIAAAREAGAQAIDDRLTRIEAAIERLLGRDPPLARPPAAVA